MKRGEEDSCIYVERPEDEKTRALRTRLEYLEAQFREISSSLTSAETTQQPDTTDEADIAIVRQFSKLHLRSKDDKAIYYGPNCWYGILSEYPEIFNIHARRKKNETCQLLKNSSDLLEDEFPVTGFPFNALATDYNLQAMLPERTLCDTLIVRYFDCCNCLLNVIDLSVYSEQYLNVWDMTSSPQKSHIAITFFMLAIAVRSLNDGHELMQAVSTEGQLGALKMSKRWKKYGQLALSQNNLMQRGSLTNIQALLLLCSLEDRDHARWNVLGLLGNMARITGLYRDPSAFPELDDKAQKLRRSQFLKPHADCRRLWAYIYILDQTGISRS
jgi:Fungal specific transcription factor domain